MSPCGGSAGPHRDAGRQEPRRSAGRRSFGHPVHARPADLVPKTPFTFVSLVFTINLKLCYDYFIVDRKRQIIGLFKGDEPLQAGEVARVLGVTRQTAHRHLRELVVDGLLIIDGAGRSTRYRRSNPVDARRFSTGGLEEDRVWSVMSGPGMVASDLPKATETVLHYILTELVNNAIDHSGSAEVDVRVARKGSTISLDVRDEGVGIFRHIRDKLGLDSELEALQELSKGKTTTMPSRHTGEGIFFSSKAANRFEIISGTLRWIVDNRKRDMAVGTSEAAMLGTTVRAEIDCENTRDLTSIFAEYTRDLEFSKTRTIVRLFAIGTEFLSRSQAKRVVHGLEKFREVVLDFEGVDIVGQGFADEIFRVWARHHPEVLLVPSAMNDPVAFMVERAIRGARSSD
jgi:anti-sigma regulatory factor (Ser/Thr protein kinase)